MVEGDWSGARVSVVSPVSLIAACAGFSVVCLRIAGSVWYIGGHGTLIALPFAVGVTLLWVGLRMRSSLGLLAALLSVVSLLALALQLPAVLFYAVFLGLAPPLLSPDFNPWAESVTFWTWVVPFASACGLLVSDAIRIDFNRL
jgi:hypothetical protein